MASSPAVHREQWIDATRGIGIVLVVVGHVVGGTGQRSAIFNAIYLFHMPLFFALSGYLHSFKSSKFLALARAKSLIVPYICYVLIFSMLEVFYGIYTHQYMDLIQIGKEIIKRLYGGQLLIELYTVFWFVPVLYVTILLHNGIFKNIGRASTTLTLILLASLIASALNLAPPLPTPLNLTAVPAALVCYSMGYFVRRYVGLGRNLVLISVAVLVLSAVAHLYLGLSWQLDLKYLDVGPPIVGLLLALSISFLLMVGIRYVGRWTSSLTDILALVGASSLTLMFWHQWVNLTLRFWGITNDAVIIVVAIAFGLIAHFLLNTNALTQRFLLGNRSLKSPLSVTATTGD